MQHAPVNFTAAAFLFLCTLPTSADEAPGVGAPHLDAPGPDGSLELGEEADPETLHENDGDSAAASVDDFENWEDFIDDEAVYETEVKGYRIRPTDEVTGFAETIEVADERKSVTDLSEVLSHSVGVQVRTMGGLGAYGAASVRGSTPNQVPVFIDGVQLNIGGFSAVNLGDFSLDILDHIEVYRGNTPLKLGIGGIGGAVVLRTRALGAPVNEFAASYGSWNTWRLLTLYGGRVGGVDTLAIVSGQHADGDFKYFNRNGTFNNPDDDEFVHRSNNDHTAYSALLKLGRDIGAWRVHLMDDFFFKTQGLAGIDHMVDHSTAELETLRNSVNLRLERPIGEQTLLGFDLAYLIMREHFDDMGGSIGVGHQNHVYRMDGAFGAILLQSEFSAKHITTVRIAGRYEHYREDRINLTEDDQQSPSYRIKTELGAEHDWNPVTPLHIVPTLRGELHYTYFDGGPTPALQTDFEATDKTDFYFSPSLGIRWELIEGLLLRVNGGRYTRTPDLCELFGDRGAVIGNPDLKAEVGYNVDAGVTYILAGKAFLDFLRVDAVWFASWVEDLISLEQNSQSTSRPVNIDAATIQGAEFALRIAVFDLVTLSGNYTHFHGVNNSDMAQYNGKDLPARPPHEIYGRLALEKTLTHVGFAGWFDTDYAGKAYAGQYNNEDFVTKHFFLGAGGRLELPRTGFTITFEVKNLLDALVFKNENGDWLPMSDYNRYPLPGRTLMATVHWQRPPAWL